MPENKERKGWCLFHDWVAVLNRLDKGAAWDVIQAIDQYYLTGNDPVKMVNSIEQQVVVVMMYQQIKRLEDVSAKRKMAGQKGGLSQNSGGKSKQSVATSSKGKQTKAKDSKSKQSVATYTITETETITETITETEPSVQKNGECDIVVLPDNDNDIIEQRFERFYAVYPRKQAKADARRAFKKLKPSEELLQVMIAAVEEQKTWDGWTKDGGQFIPHPATWLNQGRWEDEKQQTEPQGSFETDSFYDAAVNKTFGEN